MGGGFVINLGCAKNTRMPCSGAQFTGPPGNFVTIRGLPYRMSAINISRTVASVFLLFSSILLSSCGLGQYFRIKKVFPEALMNGPVLFVFPEKDQKLNPTIEKGLGGFFGIFNESHGFRLSSRLTRRDCMDNNLVLFGYRGNETGQFREILSRLPMEIRGDSFRFGGVEYGFPLDRVAFLWPSPFRDDRYLLVFYGNDWPAATMIFDIVMRQQHEDILGKHTDYLVMTSSSEVIAQGAFTKDESVWRVDETKKADVAEENRKKVRRYFDAFLCEERANFVFHFDPGIEDSSIISHYISSYQDCLDFYIETLGLANPFECRHHVYLSLEDSAYRYPGTKGSSNTASASTMGNHTFLIYWEDRDRRNRLMNEEGPHEIAHHFLSSDLRALNEGWPVYLSVLWKCRVTGMTEREIYRSLLTLEAGSAGVSGGKGNAAVVRLEDLLGDFENNGSFYYSAGFLTSYLVAEFGMKKTISLYEDAEDEETFERLCTDMLDAPYREVAQGFSRAIRDCLGESL